MEVRDKEASSKKGAFTLLDDEDDDEEERNKGRPNGTKKAKDNMRKDSKASSLREKIDHMVKSNELMVTMTIEAKKELAMKRSQEKEEKWHQIKEIKLRKADIEDKRAQAEETIALAKLIAEENKIMTMNRNEMDEITLE
ncbi:Lactation elevated protein 1 [Hordeum vulgare]|nr:Lactation elevated protein 1 [Hordeum vulgare]